MSHDSVRKYVQVNHLLDLLAPRIEDLAARHKTIRIVDAGSGKAYLSLVLAWALREIWSLKFEIHGVESNQTLAARAGELAVRLGFADTVRFSAAKIGDINFLDLFGRDSNNDPFRPNLVVALHACDTATDDAVAGAIAAKADAIAVAPCCQAELASLWKLRAGTRSAGADAPIHPMTPVFDAPEMRRALAAEITDSYRMLLLRARGYEVTTTEFVSSFHTAKNRLILATRRGNYLEAARRQYEALKAHMGGDAISLEAKLAATATEGSASTRPQTE